jgi:hypothetical protein
MSTRTIPDNSTTTSSFPTSWYKLWELDQKLDFDEFLQSDLLANRQIQMQTKSIIFHVTGAVSVLSSTCIILHILRSYDRLSSIYHRLVFVLSMAEILSSASIALSSSMVPKEMDYFVPHARGSMSTCTMQGFFICIGYLVAGGYNCSICFYYYATISHNKKEEHIRAKLEPWFHGISIICPLIFIGAIGLSINQYNSLGGICQFYPNLPPHCIGYELGEIPEGFSIPCGRGTVGNNQIILYIVYGALMFFGVIVPFSVIVGTMFLMYRSVRKIEKKMQNYGISALRSLRTRDSLSARTLPNDCNDLEGYRQTSSSRKRYSATRSSLNARHPNGLRNSEISMRDSSDVRRTSNHPCHYENNGRHRTSNAILGSASTCNHGRSKTVNKIKASIKCIIPCYFRIDDRPKRRSNQMISVRKRSILKMATAYALAWSFVFIPYVMDTLLRKYFAGEILFACLTPLQGFFNLLVFMSPKVRNCKKYERKEVNWFQAFCIEYRSRGVKDSSRVNARLSTRRRSSLQERKSLTQRFLQTILIKFLSNTTQGSGRNSQENAVISDEVLAAIIPMPDCGENIKIDDSSKRGGLMMADESEIVEETNALNAEDSKSALLSHC